MHTSQLGTLFVTATPIGNLGDFSERAIQVLHDADVVLCEDTRVTRKLLQHYDIETPAQSLHQHSTEAEISQIGDLIEQGKDLALVSDAGTPGISDPGGKLIEYLYDRFGEGCEVFAIPGPSAVVAALSVSGFQAERFVFMGFPPHKKKRKQFFEEVAQNQYTTAFFESNHRITKALEQLQEVLEPERQLSISREITKKFESHYRGTMKQLLAMNISSKGEFVVVVAPKLKHK